MLRIPVANAILRLFAAPTIALTILAWCDAAPAERRAPAANPERFGVNAGLLWRDDSRLQPELHAAAIGRSGLRSVRAIAFWNLVEPGPPDPRTGEHRFDWRDTDRIAEQLARNRLRWYALLGFSTAWGGEVPGTTFGPPRIQPFSEYAAAFARRYGRRGTFWKERPELPYAPVVSFEVWNEPNLFTFWLPRPEPDRYADLYLAVRTAVHQVDAHARVVVGGLAHSTSDDSNASGFLRRMFDARRELTGNVDAVGLTVYSRTAEQTIGQIVEARRTLDALGERSTPLDLNETGWTTSGVLPFTVAPVDEHERVARLTRLVELLAASDCGISTVMPFAWVTAEDNPADQSAWFGLADRATASLKPAGAAYVAAVDAALGTGSRSVTTACGRRDLPPFVQAPRHVPRRFTVRLVRRCSARRLKVHVTLGDEPEPYQRLEVALPGGGGRVVLDPDAGGPAAARTVLAVKLPRRRGSVLATAFDELGRARARGSARLARCPARRR